MIGTLRGVGDLKWLMVVTILSVVFLEIGLNWALIFVLNYSLLALWLVHFFDEILRSGINYLRFRSGKWKVVEF